MQARRRHHEEPGAARRREGIGRCILPLPVRLSDSPDL
jgi:hypothetical protein